VSHPFEHKKKGLGVTINAFEGALRSGAVAWSPVTRDVHEAKIERPNITSPTGRMTLHWTNPMKVAWIPLSNHPLRRAIARATEEYTKLDNVSTAC
jgi:hypothetical protein